MDSRVYPTLHSKCNHQIIYSKLNLEIKYPPTYAREVLDHGKAQFDLINVAIENFDWNKLLSGHNIRNQINLFNRTIFKFFRNFIPNMDILCDDKKPPWVNDEFKLLIKRKNVNIQTQMRGNRLDLSILNKLIKENLFNEFLAINVISLIMILSVDFETTRRISSFDFCNDKITRIIWSLDPNKAHRCDRVSILHVKIMRFFIMKTFVPTL